MIERVGLLDSWTDAYRFEFVIYIDGVNLCASQLLRADTADKSIKTYV